VADYASLIRLTLESFQLADGIAFATLLPGRHGAGPRLGGIMIYLLGMLMGVVGGLRAMMPAAALSWAAWLGVLKLDGTWLSFLGSIWAVILFTVLAIGELVTDQLPSTPSRKVPPQFGARVFMGAIAGIAIAGTANWLLGGVAGLIGAVIGTLGGAELRGRLAAHFGRDQPAAFIEDAVAIVGAALIVLALK
jgi:uncharacterized membrane protein